VRTVATSLPALCQSTCAHCRQLHDGQFSRWSLVHVTWKCCGQIHRRSWWTPHEHGSNDRLQTTSITVYVHMISRSLAEVHLWCYITAAKDNFNQFHFTSFSTNNHIIIYEIIFYSTDSEHCNKVTFINWNVKDNSSSTGLKSPTSVLRKTTCSKFYDKAHAKKELEGTHRVQTNAVLLLTLTLKLMFQPKTMSPGRYPKVIPYTKFEHFRIIHFWVMLWILVWRRRRRLLQ